MKEKINIAELLKDCPKGIELDCTIFNDVVFNTVDFGKTIIVTRTNGTDIHLDKYGTFSNGKDAKCVIFPKGKTTWEGFQRPFKSGDILYINVTDESDDEQHEFIFILDRIYNNKIHSYCHYYIHDGVHLRTAYLADNKYPIRFATEEEKQKLFQAIKEHGYKWNAETKTLEKLPKFKNGDVIVCENHWGPFISIFKENVTERNGFIGHCVLDLDDNKFKVKDSASYFNEVRFATKREKELLFVAIERNGYQWNSETNTLEKLIEPRFDITTLVPFKSEVLVRNDEHQYWIPAFWGFKEKSGYTTTFGWCKYCIPYEGNEHLLGTANDCDEHFKTWE